MTDAAGQRPRAIFQARALFGAMRAQAGAAIWLALFFLVLGSLTEGLSILLLLPILALIAAQGDAVLALDLTGRDLLGLDLPDMSIPLWAMLAALVGLVALQAAFARIRSLFLSRVMHDFSNALRHRLFAAIARARWDHILKQRTADLEHALTGEVERIKSASMLLLAVLQGFVTLVFYLALGLLVSLPMTLFSAGFGLTALIVLSPYRRVAAQYGVQMQDNRQRQFRAVSDFLAGLKAARSMNHEDVHLSGFERILATSKDDATRFLHRAGSGAALFQIALAIGAALFIYLALTMARLDVAQIVVLLLILMRLAPRFMSLQTQVQQLLIDLPAWHQLEVLSDNLSAAHDPSATGRTPAPRPQRDIRLERVTYRYAPDRPPALQDCSLRLKVGDITALIGPSGSGKSTVADILTGLVQPQSGMLLIDGQSLPPDQVRSWRDRIAYVPQDCVLPHGTILQALLTGIETATEAQIEAALEMAAASFVTALPQGLQTAIGDRGVLLSGGERQRIALARAFLRMPDLLILDESTSALDWLTQRHIARSVQAIAGPVTVLTIAHRPSMVDFASTIHALEAGSVVESGQREDLLARKDGAYARMVRVEAVVKGPVEDDCPTNPEDRLVAIRFRTRPRARHR